jgi:hypothetical protein
MWQFLVLCALAMVGGGYILEMEQRHPGAAPQEEALAINMGVYRAAMLSYLGANRATFSGVTVAPTDAQAWFPPGYVRHGAWQNIVEPADHRLIVYAANDKLPVPITATLSRVAGYSQNAGEARGGKLYVPAPYTKGLSNAVQAALPASVPEGAPVWAGQY